MIATDTSTTADTNLSFVKKNGNGSLSYVAAGVSYKYDLWVTSLQQPLALAGNTSQSRVTKHFYPSGYTLGDLTVGGICGSQEEYQGLSLFIRTHQLALMNQPNTENFLTNSGASRLLTISIPDEGILYSGFVKIFTLTKKGVFEPAPEFTFPFSVVHDPHSTEIDISVQLRKQNTLGGFDNVPNPDTNLSGLQVLESDNAWKELFAGLSKTLDS